MIGAAISYLTRSDGWCIGSGTSMVDVAAWIDNWSRMPDRIGSALHLICVFDIDRRRCPRMNPTWEITLQQRGPVNRAKRNQRA
jgi:hypothetical protein